MQTQENTKKEILSFGRAMVFQCVLLFVGFCAGLWVSRYCFLAIAAFTVLSSFGRDLKNVVYQLLFSLPFTMVYKLSPSGASSFAYAMIAVGVGGHCISVDPWFLVGDYPSLAKVIDESMKTNDGMPDFVLNRIREIMKENNISDFSKVGLYGLSYKEDVDDPRESPTIQPLESQERRLAAPLKS